MSRRRSRRVAPGRRAGSVLMASGGSAPRRRRGRRPPRGGRLRLGAFLRGIGVLAVLAAIAGGVVVWQTHTTAAQDRRDAAERFTTAWSRSDWAAMWRALTPAAQKAHPQAGFAAANRNALRAAGVR